MRIVYLHFRQTVNRPEGSRAMGNSEVAQKLTISGFDSALEERRRALFKELMTPQSTPLSEIVVCEIELLRLAKLVCDNRMCGSKATLCFEAAFTAYCLEHRVTNNTRDFFWAAWTRLASHYAPCEEGSATSTSQTIAQSWESSFAPRRRGRHRAK